MRRLPNPFATAGLWLDALARNQELDPERRWAVRAAALIAVVMACALPIFTISNLFIDPRPMAVVTTGMLAVPIAAVLWIRTTGRPRPAMHLIAAACVLPTLVSAIPMENTASLSLPWLALLVIVFTLVGGTQVGVVWASVALVGLAAMPAVTNGFGLEVHELSFAYRRASGAVNVAMMVGLALVMGLTWDRVRRDMLRERLAARDELRAAERKALLAERLASVGTLATGVAHEINNPLAYVALNLELIEARLGDDRELREWVREARGGTARVQAIVRQLGTFARGHKDDRVAAVDVERVLEASIRLVGVQLAHRADLERDYRPIPPVAGNEGQLAQVFVNLLQNAVHAIPEGRHGQIHVSTREGPDGVTIGIRDDGVGMTEQVAARVFEPFFTTKDVGQGTGLGLAICHGIVEALGGTITVEAELGSGSEFLVTLPAASALPSFGSMTPAPARLRTSSGLRILVVDDEPLLGRVIRRALDPRHTIVVDHLATEALARFERHEEFDLVFCDVMMPQMAGWELHAALGKRHPDVLPRIVYVSGGAFTSSAQDFLESIPNRVLWKPFSVTDLRAIVEEFAEAS